MIHRLSHIKKGYSVEHANKEESCLVDDDAAGGGKLLWLYLGMVVMFVVVVVVTWRVRRRTNLQIGMYCETQEGQWRADGTNLSIKKSALKWSAEILVESVVTR